LTQFYPVSQPSIGSKEIAYVSDAVASGWVSSLGRYIEEFESGFAQFCGTRYALALSNGTTGLHLALVTLGIRAGDEVIVPDLTFVATANAVVHAGASIAPVDIDESTLCIDVAAIERALSPKTRAIIPVHLYGHPAAMHAIEDLARKHDLFVIEDAAEAHGARIGQRRVGGFGDCAVFSFYGNKIITSGEGGMLTTDDEQLYLKARRLRDHAMSSERRYWHTEVGYNYRMTNLQAALGLAQLERIGEFLEHRQQLMQWYRDELADVPGLRLNRQQPDCHNVYWMVCLEIAGLRADAREHLMRALKADGVDSRPYFYPVSDLPMYQRADTPVAHRIHEIGINLPSYFDLKRQDVVTIGAAVRRAVSELVPA
jgi:perosamine synthetase